MLLGLFFGSLLIARGLFLLATRGSDRNQLVLLGLLCVVLGLPLTAAMGWLRRWQRIEYDGTTLLIARGPFKVRAFPITSIRMVSFRQVKTWPPVEIGGPIWLVVGDAGVVLAVIDAPY